MSPQKSGLPGPLDEGITLTDFHKTFKTRLTPLRKEKDERRANYEKRRDQRRRSVHSSDHEAKKEIPKLTSTPKKTKKPKDRLLKIYFIIDH